MPKIKQMTEKKRKSRHISFKKNKTASRLTADLNVNSRH